MKRELTDKEKQEVNVLTTQVLLGLIAIPLMAGLAIVLYILAALAAL